MARCSIDFARFRSGWSAVDDSWRSHNTLTAEQQGRGRVMLRTLVSLLAYFLVSQDRRSRFGVAMFGALALMTPQVLAQTKATAVVGTEVSLLKDSKELIDDAKATVGDAFAKSVGTGDAKRYELVYRAPQSVPDKPVEVIYRVGKDSAAKEQRVEVTVTPAPVTDVRTVLPGTDTVLRQSTKLMEVIGKPSIGLTTVRQTENPKTYSLAYVAPGGVVYERTVVDYREDGKPGQFEVVVSSNPWGTGYEAAFKILFAAFVLAVLIEWGLAVIFNWRWFLMIFDARGVKTVVTFIVSVVLVVAFDMDVVRELVNILRNASYESTVPTWTLSALVVAGGSAGVNSLMVTLGFRSVRTAETLQDKPPPTKAWLAVQAYKTTATIETVEVRIKKAGEANFSVLAVLRGLRKSRWTFRWPFFLDKSRYPSYGGIPVEPGVQFEVQLQGKDSAENDVGGPVNAGSYAPAAGALIDVEKTL
jgi:hypothetical protein